MKKKISLLEANIGKAIFTLMIPTLIGGIFQQVYNIAEGVIIGNYIGDVGTAIVGGSAGSLVNWYVSLNSGLNFGFLAIIAFKAGAQDEYGIVQTLKTAVVSVLSAGLFGTFLYLLFAPQLLGLLKVPNDVLSKTVSYVRIYSLSFVFYSLFQLSIAVLRAKGNTKTATGLLLASYGINVILDVLLIGVFHMEQIGVALAYTLTHLLMAGVSLLVLRNMVQINFIKEEFDFSILKDVLKIAVPAALGSIGFSVSSTMIQSGINMLGSEYITCYALNNKVEKILWIVLDGIGVSATTLIGQNYGAKKYDRVKKTIFLGCLYSALSSMLISVVVFFGKERFVSLFTKEAATKALTCDIIDFMSRYYVAYFAIDVIQAGLKCLGYSMASTVIVSVTVCLFRVVYLLFYAWSHLSYQSVLASFPLSWALASLTYVAYYILVVKKKLKNNP